MITSRALWPKLPKTVTVLPPWAKALPPAPVSYTHLDVYKRQGYDTYIDTEVGVDTSADLQSEMSVILVLAAIVIVLVLTLTSRSYAEVPVLIMTFGAAALLNMEMCIRDRFL